MDSQRTHATASPSGVSRPVDSVEGLAAGVCVCWGARPYPGRTRPESDPPSEDGLFFSRFRSPQATVSSARCLGQTSVKKAVSCTKAAKHSAPAELLRSQSSASRGLASFGTFNRDFQRFRACGQKKKWAGAFGRPQLHSVVASSWWNRVW